MDVSFFLFAPSLQNARLKALQGINPIRLPESNSDFRCIELQDLAICPTLEQCSFTAASANRNFTLALLLRADETLDAFRTVAARLLHL